jgi:hypothetical protein
VEVGKDVLGMKRLSACQQHATAQILARQAGPCGPRSATLVRKPLILPASCASAETLNDALFYTRAISRIQIPKTRALTTELCTSGSCFPRSQNRGLGHPSLVQLQAVRDLVPGPRRFVVSQVSKARPGAPKFMGTITNHPVTVPGIGTLFPVQSLVKVR